MVLKTQNGYALLCFGIRDALRLQPNYSTDKFLKEPLSSAYKNLSGF
jgi:hypothetical protein